MQVSVETLQGLQRKITISIPTEHVEQEVNTRLRKLATKAKIDGFRPGHVPINKVKARYADNVREEVARDLIQSSLPEALETNRLNPADMPAIDFVTLKPNEDFIFSATFEVLPLININELNQAEVDVVSAQVQENDVDMLIEKLQLQHQDWQEVERTVADGDKVVFDFQGLIDDQPFKGGNAKNHELIVGSNTMIPGFESGLIGHEANQSFDINVTFPNDYAEKTLQGKSAIFKITLHKVLAGQLPELNQDFFDKFNIKKPGIEAFRHDIKENMVRELERQVSARNRENVFNKLLEINHFDLPQTLIEKEIKQLMHEMYHRIFGHQHSDDEKIPDFPRELFIDQAKKRVQLSLLFAEYINCHQIVIDDARVNTMIEKMAEAYENPEELRQWYRQKPENRAEIEALVMEEIVTEKIREHASVREVALSYDEVMNPKNKTQTTGA